MVMKATGKEGEWFPYQRYRHSPRCYYKKDNKEKELWEYGD